MSAEILSQLADIAGKIRALPDHELCTMLQLAALGKAAKDAPARTPAAPTVTTPLPPADGPKPRRSVPASDPQDVEIVAHIVNGQPDGVSMAAVTAALAKAEPAPWSRSKAEAACRNAVLQSKIGRVGEKKGAKLVRVDYPGAIYGVAAYD